MRVNIRDRTKGQNLRRERQMGRSHKYYLILSSLINQACDQLETKKKENLTTPQATPP